MLALTQAAALTHTITRNFKPNKELWESCSRKAEYRERRPHPFKDDKILTFLERPQIAAMAIGGRSWQPRYVAAAERAADYIKQPDW